MRNTIKDTEKDLGMHISILSKYVYLRKKVNRMEIKLHGAVHLPHHAGRSPLRRRGHRRRPQRQAHISPQHALKDQRKREVKFFVSLKETTEKGIRIAPAKQVTCTE